MKRNPKPLFLAFALFGATTVSFADTNVSGAITSDTTWTLAGSPYIVTGNVTVYGNATTPAVLTIEAGVEVRFNLFVRLIIGSGANKGGLNVTGTAVSPVLFTSNQTTKTRGYWGRLEFTSATDAATTVLDHFTVEYGGYGGFGTVYVNASTPTFRNGTIRESSNYGIYLSGTSGSLVLESTTVQNNTNRGIHVNQGSLSVQDMTFSGTESTYAMSMPAATQVLRFSPIDVELGSRFTENGRGLHVV